MFFVMIHMEPVMSHRHLRSQAGMIGFITLQQSAPSQMTWQDSNAFGEH
jgi:hypothetical protein